jgi:hypothetical protein
MEHLRRVQPLTAPKQLSYINRQEYVIQEDEEEDG